MNCIEEVSIASDGSQRIETSGGEFAGNCICRADYSTGIGLFEPLGTRYAFRKQGLGRAINPEGLRRLGKKGMRWATIGTANFNFPAKATYLSCGLKIIAEEHGYEKILEQVRSQVV